VFEGPDERVARLVAWAHRGPVQATVTDVVVHTEPPEGLTGFAID
jgi:acylphosphatase